MRPIHPAHDHHAHATPAAGSEDRVVARALEADTYEPVLRAVTEALLDAVSLRPGARLLDLACGLGHCAAAAQARGAEALGLDISVAVIEAARRRFPATRFVVGDMMDPPEGPWDAVISRFGAHHAEPAWLVAAHRVLRPGGRIAIAEIAMGRDAPPHEAHGMVDEAEWRRRFEAAGFEEVRIDACDVRLPAAMSPRGRPSPPMTIVSGRRPARDHQERAA